MSLRIALYSHNGFGLGHIRRNLLLAQGLLRRRPNADILVITGAAGLHQFQLGTQVDYIKLPSVRKKGTGRWRPYNLDMQMESLLRLRRTIILESIRTYRPHLFVADFLPQGVEGELIPTLEELAARPEARAVMGFRDILDDPATVRASWALDGTVEVLKNLYDLVLVYGDREWFDFADYGLDAGFLHYVGLMTEPMSLGGHLAARGSRVLATSGGGEDGYAILAAALGASEMLQETLDANVRCTAVAGPMMAPEDFERLRAIGKRVGGRVHRFADDFRSKLERAAAVVGMGGYNTVGDILTSRRPALIIPRAGPSMEQQIRARIMKERGLASVLQLAQSTDRAVAEALIPLLEGYRFPEEALPPLTGLRLAVDSLLDLVA
jgi:predicted glycosyltransferase